jgi:hypothetical protein
VLDEADGLVRGETTWRALPTSLTPLPPAPPHRPRWRAPVAVGVVALVLLGGAWWARPTTAPGPPAVLAPQAEVPVRPEPQPVAPAPPGEPAAPAPVEAPSVEVAALADEAFLSDEGRALFYRARPELLGAGDFAGRCDVGTALRVRTDAVGCFTGSRIIVYVPADARLRGFVVETVAHETLHAAWEVLAPDVRRELTTLLEAELAGVPADRPLHEQLAGSVGDRPENRPTELFAYIGTQVWRDGGLAPRLEEVYARFVTDRAALVAVHTGWRGMVDTMRSDVEAAQRALAERRHAHARLRAQHDAETAAVTQYRQAYEQQVAEVTAMPAEEQDRLQLSWTWWDGTDLPMAPAQQTLATAAQLLTRDDDVLASRAAALAADESALVGEQARVDALVADFRGLTAQLVPGAA